MKIFYQAKEIYLSKSTYIGKWQLNEASEMAWISDVSLRNAAMVAVAGYFKFMKSEFDSQDLVPYARQSLKE